MIPMITALAAGNAVVLKCSERTPETAALIARLCAQADLPPDLVQVLHDSPEESSALIDAGPDIILFTGSSRHGRSVAERAARYLIPAILELGGKDAALVFADCHIERAVEGITYGAFSNAGQGLRRQSSGLMLRHRFTPSLSHGSANGLRISHVGNDATADLLPTCRGYGIRAARPDRRRACPRSDSSLVRRRTATH